MNKHSEDILKELIYLHEKNELQGAFDGIPIDVYHHKDCPGISATKLKYVIETTYNHWLIDRGNESKSLRFGTALHCLINEPHLFEKQYYVCPADSKRDKKYQDALRLFDGIVLLQPEFDQLTAVSKKIFTHPVLKNHLIGSNYERTYFSYDQETGLLKKCRADIVNNNLKSIVDIKSTESASEYSFQKDCLRYLYRIPAAYYMSIISEVSGEIYNNFYFAACEKQEPYEIAIYEASENSLNKAYEEIKLALSRIKAIQKGEWSGYELNIKKLNI